MIVKVKAVNGFRKTDGCYNTSDKIVELLRDYKNNIKEIICDKNNIEESEEKIYDKCKNLFMEDKKIILIGGDHSITYSSGKAFLEYCKTKNKKPFFVVFDAHADCMEPEKNPSNESWLRALLGIGLDDNLLAIVGVRNISGEEKSFYESHKFWKISCDEILLNIEEATDFITELINKEDVLVYVSIDMDVVDPAFAPSVAYPEPAGLTSQQIIYIINRISKLKNIKVVDVVEIDVDKDKKKDLMTCKLANSIINKFLY